MSLNSMELERSNSVDPVSPAPSTGDDVYSGAIERISRFMMGLGLALTAGAWWEFGHSSALGFLGGSIIAFLNFRWLKSGVTGLADRVTHAAKPKSGTGIVARFLLRYVLMGGAAYGIRSEERRVGKECRSRWS